MKTGILFDLDGTLLDTLEDLLDATNYALEHHGYPCRTLGELRGFVGNGARNQIRLSVPEGADPEPVLETYQRYYPGHCRIKTAPYPGIMQALKCLGEQYPLAIVSNKPDAAVKPLCAEFFPGIFALGETGDTPRKPSPQMVHAAMEAIGVQRCVYVGDSEVDVLTAKNASVPCLSVTWGFRDREVLEAAGADWFCHDPGELPEAIALIIETEDFKKNGQ